MNTMFQIPIDKGSEMYSCVKDYWVLIKETSLIGTDSDSAKKNRKAFEEFLAKHVDMTSDASLEDTFAFKLANALLDELNRIKAEGQSKVPLPLTK